MNSRGKKPRGKVSDPAAVRERKAAAQRRYRKAMGQEAKLRELCRRTSRAALSLGILAEKADCEFCGAGNRRLEMHHFDYGKPLDVHWFCRPCHLKVHRLMSERSAPTETTAGIWESPR